MSNRGEKMQQRRKLNLKIGDTIWRYESKWRSQPGWKEYKITAESSRSWIFGPSWDETKIPKNGDLSKLSHNLAFSLEEVAERDWLDTHPQRICRKMQYMRHDNLTIAQWKQIAEIVGYKDEDQ